MYKLKRLVFILRRQRGRLRRLRRIIFMSPAESEFVRIMGGKVVTIKTPFHKFPATLVLSRGRILRRQRVRREVRYGKHFSDFANDLDRIIEIDGQTYHMDVVADQDRDNYIKLWCQDRGRYAQIYRIQAYKLYRQPEIVRAKVTKFLLDGHVK